MVRIVTSLIGRVSHTDRYGHLVGRSRGEADRGADSDPRGRWDPDRRGRAHRSGLATASAVRREGARGITRRCGHRIRAPARPRRQARAARRLAASGDPRCGVPRLRRSPVERRVHPGVRALDHAGAGLAHRLHVRGDPLVAVPSTPDRGPAHGRQLDRDASSRIGKDRAPHALGDGPDPGRTPRVRRGDATVAHVVRTWDADWEERRAGKSCPMCNEGRPDETHGNARIFAGRVSDAYLVRGDVGQPGYTIVIWRGRHVADATELADADAAAYLREVLTVARAIEAQFRPAKLNLAMYGNSVPHLHAHLVPRYVTDDSPGEPPRFLRVQEGNRGEMPEDKFHRDVAALRVALARRFQLTTA